MQVKHFLNVISINKLRYQKRIPLMDVFIISQIPRREHLRRKLLSSESKGRKTTALEELKHIRYFNIINIAEC